MNALYVICGLGFVSLLAEIINFKKGLTLLLVIGVIGAIILIAMDWNTTLHYYNNMLVFDNFSIVYTALILVVSVFWFWMNGSYFSDDVHQTDKSTLVLFTIAGGIIMVSFANMAMLFLGIEILSISLYALAGSRKESLLSNESSFKYFIMGSFATGFLLMGIALVYGASGSFYIFDIAGYIDINGATLPGFFYVGVLLMLVGMAFKISAVPFHFWAPDVYEGAPTPITAFMSTVVKVAAIGAFFRVFSYIFYPVQSSFLVVLQIIAVLTLILPNVTAVYQISVKRMLAYSSVGHVGYILLAFISDSINASGTIFYYLVSYSITSIAAFAVLSEIEKSKSAFGFDGLYKRNGFLAVVMTIALLSLAGIPPLAGFFGKYMVFTQAIANGHTGLVVIAIITSLIGVFYYFRVIIAMYVKLSDETPLTISFSSAALMTVLVLLILAAGIFPDAIVKLLARA